MPVRFWPLRLEPLPNRHLPQYEASRLGGSEYRHGSGSVHLMRRRELRTTQTASTVGLRSHGVAGMKKFL